MLLVLVACLLPVPEPSLHYDGRAEDFDLDTASADGGGDGAGPTETGADGGDQSGGATGDGGSGSSYLGLSGWQERRYLESETSGQQPCVRVWSLSGEPSTSACPGCTFTFDVTFEVVDEHSVEGAEGACDALLGSGTGSFGYAPSAEDPAVGEVLWLVDGAWIELAPGTMEGAAFTWETGSADELVGGTEEAPLYSVSWIRGMAAVQ
jgi:hypothetical protein